MNAHSDSQFNDFEKATLSPEDELLVERLVDGELSDEEREDLVYRLDEMIDGWRFCALSFLEAQSFRAALRNLSDGREKQVVADKPQVQKDLDVPLRKSSTKTWRNYSLSAAAGFLVAAVSFGSVGVFGPSPSAPAPPNDLAQTSGSTRHDFEGAPLVSPQEELPVALDQHVQPVAISSSPGSSLLAGSVTPRTVVLNNPSQGLSNVTTTCEEVADYDPQTFQTANSAIPQEVVNHMYNVGGSVDAHRDEYRFPLDNGRVLILPVDTYNVKSDGNQLIW